MVVDRVIRRLPMSPPVKCWGGLFYLHIVDVPGGQYYDSGYESGIIEIAESLCVLNQVRKGDVVVDVGAHIGFYTCMCGKLVGPEGRVIAIEPEPYNLEYLKMNIYLNNLSNVTLHECVVTDEVGTRNNLYLDPTGTTPGMNQLWEPTNGDGECVSVSGTTIDDLCRDYPKVNFIKLDIQGSEYKAIVGAQDVIRRSPNVSMLVECSENDLVKMGTSGKGLLGLLFRLGFAVYVISPHFQDNRLIDGLSLVGLFPGAREVVPDGVTVNLWCVKK